MIRPNKNYTIASAYGTAIGFGDPVIAVTTGAFGPNVAIATAATAPVLGIFAGCTYENTEGEFTFRRNWVASTATLNSADAMAWIYDDPFIIYQIQTVSGTALTAAHIWEHADFTDTGPEAFSGMSRREVDLATVGSDVNLHIMGLVKRADNAFGLHADVYVMINEHALRNSGAVSAQNLA